ncbi:DUF3823 domain-containing protein [Aureibaculum algae]|uniref:DUF3823 domain-containing protein n=1 Tax=Aureibaculum algae TaxID=2584122 RepID=A0A5B7TQH2_9FLAO|nr:DUF3823 domain-containing protein [Aureibaculum algae]QCX37423.1 DUF3823 domain-containing protein [Aureibaculum algae]
MKIRYYIFLLAAISLTVSCAIDNYDEPQSFLTGKVVHNGEIIPVENDQVKFRLYEPGYQLSSGFIEVTINQDGSYSSLLFNGQYKLIFEEGEGPFKSIDTISIDLKGSTEMDIEVTPYYMINNSQISNSGSTINATCSVSQIINGVDARDIERVTLFINKTQFVSGNGDENIAQSSADDISDLSNLSMLVDIPSITPTQNYVFARIGVKIVDVQDMLFTPVEKISF